ncbi:DEKNAAC104950, partial [Brettanomyces naardenensis]
ITTAPNIANAIIEINDEDNFKFLRDANIAGKHELFNIEQYERNQAKEEEDKKGKGASSGSGDQANATSNNTARLDDEDAVIIDTFMDTEDIVNELKSGGFTGPQAEVIMCVAREALQRKMDWLRTELAPKVDLENESYLFQAAHNELLVEVTNAREIALMNLQNSSIILKRLLNNLQDETSTKIQLNDDTIKMELSQFKHENNLQQRSLEIKNTDLNNRIISELMSGLRSNIEQFRWELTRAGIFAIMLLAASILGGWSFAKTKVKNVEERKEKEPELSYRHEPADEESHDYEADWDENVPVQLLGEASRK